MLSLVIIYVVLFVLSYGLVVLITGFKNRDKKERLQQVRISAFAAAVILGVLLLIGIEQAWVWNNGVCSECGGRYELIEIVGHRRSTSYIYQCDECGNIIEMGCALNSQED